MKRAVKILLLFLFFSCAQAVYTATSDAGITSTNPDSVAASTYGSDYTFSESGVVYSFPTSTASASTSDPSPSTSGNNDDANQTYQNETSHTNVLVTTIVAVVVGLILHVIFGYLLYVRLSCGEVTGATLRHPKRERRKKEDAKAKQGVASQVPSRYANGTQKERGRPPPDPNVMEVQGVRLANRDPLEVNGTPLPQAGHAELAATREPVTSSDRSGWRRNIGRVVR